MDVENRAIRESELQRALEIVWEQWSYTQDPNLLTEESLVALLETYAIDAVYAVWIIANRNLLDEYGLQQQENAAAVAFMFFFRSWARDIAVRWKARVAEAIANQPTEASRVYIGGGGGGGGGFVSTLVRPIGVGQAFAGEGAVEGAGDIDLRPWLELRREVVTAGDFERVATTTVTQAHTDAEKSGAATVQSQGPILIAVWNIEPGACPKCTPLDGTRENVWRKEAPNGPPLHPNCRCWLEWVQWENSGS